MRSSPSRDIMHMPHGVGRTKGAARNDDNQPSLRDSAAGDFDTCQGRFSGAQAVCSTNISG